VAQSAVCVSGYNSFDKMKPQAPEALQQSAPRHPSKRSEGAESRVKTYGFIQAALSADSVTILVPGGLSFPNCSPGMHPMPQK
jgi:hypothetical protein